LRADFEIVEKYDIENEIILEIPLFGMMGSEEENSNQIGNWNKFSKIHFSYEIIEGDHFFIYKHGQKIANLIKEFYCKAIDIQQQNFNFQWNILTSEKEEK
jgi:surfactin synthase thioesterase subunit